MDGFVETVSESLSGEEPSRAGASEDTDTEADAVEQPTLLRKYTADRWIRNQNRYSISDF